MTMISSRLSNRLIFIFSLLGLAVSAFLFYEYTFAGSVLCPMGQGCDIVRASSYAYIFGIPIPLLGIGFYLAMAVLSVIHSHDLPTKIVKRLQLLIALSGAGFGLYLTYLEVFVIYAFCFWCVLSFIISLIILISILVRRKTS